MQLMRLNGNGGDESPASALARRVDAERAAELYERTVATMESLKREEFALQRREQELELERVRSNNHAELERARMELEHRKREVMARVEETREIARAQVRMAEVKVLGDVMMMGLSVGVIGGGPYSGVRLTESQLRVLGIYSRRSLSLELY